MIPGAAKRPAPKRIQRQRTRGWQLPEGAVYVGRPTKWGNPFRGKPFDAVMDYASWLDVSLPGQAIKAAAKEELRGKDLACWCPTDQPHCHANLLLEIANS